MKRWIALAGALLLGSCGFGTPIGALAAATGAIAGHDQGAACGRPCVIQESPGGSVDGFRLQGLHLLFLKTPIIVDGYCASACTLLIDVARADVCLTTNAVLAYHQATWKGADGAVEHEVLSYETPGLNAYIAGRGGLPVGDVMLIPFEQARAFYRPCKGAS